MTSPLTGDRTQYEPGPALSAPLRASRTSSRALLWARLARAIKRQTLSVIAITVLITGVGVGFDLAGGVPLPATITFWAPIALAAGLAYGLFREFSRNTVTSLSSFGKHRGYAVLGAAPELTPSALRQLPPDKRTPAGSVAFQPASAFATAFRDLQSGFEEQGLVSFIASLPDEGATTTALCTAMSAVQQGRNIIVLDCDLRRRALTRALDCDADVGLLEACADPERWRDFIAEEHETGLHVIPAARMRNPWRSLMGSPGFSQLLEILNREYDLVILDCPPALGSADGALIAGLADRCVVVAAWDRTPLNAVRTTMRNLQRRSQTDTGVYVNRVPPQYRFGRLRPD